MLHWLRLEHNGKTCFGTVADGTVSVYESDMFASPRPTGQVLPFPSVKVLTPTLPSKMTAVWNNFHQLAAK